MRGTFGRVVNCLPRRSILFFFSFPHISLSSSFHFSSSSSSSSSFFFSLLQDNFETVYQYLCKARKGKTSDAQIQKHLASLVKNPLDCFIVDQLVYQEMFSAAK